MSYRSRSAREVAREVIRGLEERHKIEPEEFRSWVCSIQGFWGSPRSWRKGRKQMSKKAKRKVPR